MPKPDDALQRRHNRSVFYIISLFPYCFILKLIYFTASLLQPNIKVEKGDIEVFYIGVSCFSFCMVLFVSITLLLNR